jgi:hypothetical protein
MQNYSFGTPLNQLQCKINQPILKKTLPNFQTHQEVDLLKTIHENTKMKIGDYNFEPTRDVFTRLSNIPFSIISQLVKYLCNVQFSKSSS